MYISTSKLTFLLGVGAYALPSLSRNYAVKEHHAAPRDWTIVGPSSKSDTIHMQIGLKQQNEGVIEKHLMEISDPSHARYVSTVGFNVRGWAGLTVYQGKHMTSEEISSIVTPSDESRDLITAWLAEHGIDDVVHSPSKDWIHIKVSKVK